MKSGRYRRRRLQMVQRQLERRGIRQPILLEAFRRVPRHEFVPVELKGQAYRDGPLAIGERQTISQPYMVALMTQAAAIGAGDRVLEIGTGSGYQTAILLELGAEVYTVERLPMLGKQAQERLKRLGCTGFRLRLGDGTLGWSEKSPFDAILVTAGGPQAPQPLLHQLQQGGRLIIPLDEGSFQTLCVFTRTEQGFHKKRGERCTFVPLIGQYGWSENPRR